MATNFTPGPWEWDAGDIGTEYSAPYCDVYVDGGNLIIAHVNDKFDKAVGHANAALIALAPDMLDELERLAEVFGWEPHHPARQLIAKARGQ